MRFLLACVVFGAVPGYAHAAATEQRIALVIGNANYKDAPLANPVNDARAFAKELVAIGFEVKLRTNLTQSQMRHAVREFGDELYAKQGVGLFYFAGHGVQISNRNFLIPVSADIQREYEVEDQAVDASTVLSMMQSAKARVNIVILDACRNNPFMRNFRSAINGLAPMQAPAGTVLAFSTAPGETAIDGSGQNGLYTQHLLENMNVPGLKIEEVFKNVRSGVRRDSNGKQTPWENTSLEGDFYFRAPIEKPAVAAPAAPQFDPTAIERAVESALKKREAELAAAQAAKIEQETKTARASIERLTKELAELRAVPKVEPERAAPLQRPVVSPTIAQPPPQSVAELPPKQVTLTKTPAKKEAESSSQRPDAQQAISQATGSPSPNVTTTSPTQLALAVPSAPRSKPVIEVGGRVERPDVRVGDQWRYQITDGYTREKKTVAVGVVRVTENFIYTQNAPASLAALDMASTEGLLDVWDRNWNQMRNGNAEYAPYYPTMQFPLEANKNWSGTVSIDVGGSDRLIQDITSRAIGWERLTVPAGTFDAIKISSRGNYRISSPSINGGGSISDVIWYAPATRQIIKKEIQLRAFSPGTSALDGGQRFQKFERWELVEYQLN